MHEKPKEMYRVRVTGLPERFREALRTFEHTQKRINSGKQKDDAPSWRQGIEGISELEIDGAVFLPDARDDKRYEGAKALWTLAVYFFVPGAFTLVWYLYVYAEAWYKGRDLSRHALENVLFIVAAVVALLVAYALRRTSRVLEARAQKTEPIYRSGLYLFRDAIIEHFEQRCTLIPIEKRMELGPCNVGRYTAVALRVVVEGRTLMLELTDNLAATIKAWLERAGVEVVNPEQR